MSNQIYDLSYYKSLRKKLKEILSKSRFEHTLGVEFTAASLAMRYGYNIDYARIAGLLHDCAKCTEDSEKLKECKKYNIEITPVEEKCLYLLHSKLGAFYANSIYGIENEEIINAIKYHTTGRPNMTLLEKIIFVADYIEPARNKASRLTEIRKEAFINIDSCVLMILSDTIEYLKSSSSIIDETTYDTYNYYNKSNN